MTHDASGPDTALSLPVILTASFHRKAALGAWWILLAGYLIFNRPFATLGSSPLYIGEAVLAYGFLAHIGRFRALFVEPIYKSWTFRFVALFWIYGIIRAADGFGTYGFWALRDSVVATYALVAFLAPWLWGEMAAPNPSIDPAGAAAKVLKQIADWMLPISTAAAAWALALYMGWIGGPWAAAVKVDFLAIAAAVAGWMWLMAAARWISGATQQPNKGSRWAFALAALALGLGGFVLLFLLPVRALWLSIGFLSAGLACALAYTRGRKIALAGFVIAASLLVAPRILQATQVFPRVDAEFALSTDMEKWPLPNKPEPIQLAPVPRKEESATFGGERLQSIVNPNPEHFQTRQGKLAAQNLLWRAAFWVRCYRYTIRHAPLFGIGFGENLTHLLRRTAAWPLFVESQQTDPPNRSPHCAHLTLFTRLGLTGLVLWIGILSTLIGTTLQALWQCRLDPNSGQQFWHAMALFGIWLIFLCAMTFGVVLEGPMGGIWFWAVTGMLATWSGAVRATSI